MREISKRVKDLKRKSGLSEKSFEVKWVKVSKSNKSQFYIDIIDYFFDNDDVSFRAVIIDKDSLKHKASKQEHDNFYYQMCFTLINHMVDKGSTYNIYLDLKDTKGHEKTQNLAKVLANKLGDFNRECIHKVQQIRSNESQIMQLADMLIGATAYANNHPASQTSSGKKAVIDRILERLQLDHKYNGYTDDYFFRTSKFDYVKFNLVHWCQE